MASATRVNHRYGITLVCGPEGGWKTEDGYLDRKAMDYASLSEAVERVKAFYEQNSTSRPPT